ncbi:MAG TPA: hypothetical protein VM557_09130 [Thermoanaerobaculia bacterium]|nr:hypothetical protein [Thermoanaerobaculia bacterium]
MPRLPAFWFYSPQCSTTGNDTVTAADVAEPTTVASKSPDPEGLPSRIESPIGAVHPSSAAGGAGNASVSGTNTNLNVPAPATVQTTQSNVTVTETTVTTTPVETRVVRTVETKPVVTTRVTTRKD